MQGMHLLFAEEIEVEVGKKQLEEDYDSHIPGSRVAHPYENKCEESSDPEACKQEIFVSFFVLKLFKSISFVHDHDKKDQSDEKGVGIGMQCPDIGHGDNREYGKPGF